LVKNLVFFQAFDGAREFVLRKKIGLVKKQHPQ
jgi:hypothetical protein